MNNTVTLPVSNAGEAYNIVMDLKELGLIADREFTWRYQPSSTSNYSAYDEADEINYYEVRSGPTVTFTFVEESMASFIRLKYN